MKPEIRGAAVLLIGLAVCVLVAMWVFVHLLYKIAMIGVLVVGTLYLAHVLSQPHPGLFGPREGEDR